MSFPDLRTQLNQSGISKTNPALYTVIDQLLDQIETFSKNTNTNAKDAQQKVKDLSNLQFATVIDETAILKFSRAITAGTGITLDTSIPAELIINSSGGGGSSQVFSGARVETDETQAASTGFADLATPGPSVTVNLTGTTALVIVSAVANRSGGAGNSAFLGVDISGANTAAASVITQMASPGAGIPEVLAGVILFSGLTPGSTTFKLQYKNDGGTTWHFAFRGIGVIGSLGGNFTTTSAYASPPSTPATGDLWLPSDSFYELRFNGTNQIPWGPIYPCTLPDNSIFSWINQGGASVDASKGGIYLLAPKDAVGNIRIRKLAAPSTPYTITLGFKVNLINKSFQSAGFLWRNSGSGKLVPFALSTRTLSINGSAVANAPVFGPSYIEVNKWDSPTVFNSQYIGLDYEIPEVLWFKATDNGTNRICSYSVDGQNFIQLHSVVRTDFITPDEIGFYAFDVTNTIDAGMTLLSWKQT